MILSKTHVLMASAALLMTLGACNSATDSSKVTGPAAATVNGIAISQNQVDFITKQSAAHGQPDNPDARKGIVENLAMQLLISQEAAKKGLDKRPDIADQIELTRQSILANAFVQDYLKTSPVTDDLLQAEYEKIKTQMAGNEYKARHILVGTEAEAKEIIARLKKNPNTFASLAKQSSKDPGSKPNGGDLGWFDPRGMVPEFGAAAANLTKGKFTDEPVKTQFGYHVILLEDSRPKTLPPLEQIKPALQQQIQQQNLKKFLDDIKGKAKIEIVQASAPTGSPAK